MIFCVGLVVGLVAAAILVTFIVANRKQSDKRQNYMAKINKTLDF